MAGVKHDQGKADLSLIPLVALTEEAKGFMLGEKKYTRYNFTEGMKASRLVAAALRHVLQWQQGEDLDPESGASHLGHARCCLAMILECQRLGTLTDDRNLPVPTSAPTTAEQIQQLAGEGHTLGDVDDRYLKRYQEIAGCTGIGTAPSGSVVTATLPFITTGDAAIRYAKLDASRQTPVQEEAQAANHTVASRTRLPDGTEVFWHPSADLLSFLK